MGFTILLFFIAIIILCIILYKKEQKKYEKSTEEGYVEWNNNDNETFLANILTFLFAFLIIFTGIFVSSWATFSSVQNKNLVEVSNTEIYSISNDNQVNGSFALGSGIIREKMYYLYYRQGENGGYIIDKIQSDNIEIIEREDEEKVGYIKKYEEKLEHSSWFWGIGDIPIEREKRVIIYIPKGTIKIDFDISLSNNL